MNTEQNIRAISTQDLMTLGLSDLAYVKPQVQDGQEVFAIFSADGREVAIMPSRLAAEATIRQNDLEPVSIH